MPEIKWILDNDIKLVQALSAGHTMSNTATIFGTTVTAIRKRLDRIRSANGYETNFELVADFMRKKIIK